jgi:Tfp pilus assembly protein PilO
MRSIDRNILVAVPLVAVLGAFWLLVISPKQDQVKQLDTKVSKAQQSIQDEKASITQGLQARKDFSRDYHRLVVSGKAAPVNPETASLLVQIDRAAGASAVKFLGIGSGNGSSGAGGTGTTTPPTPGTEAASSGPEGLSSTAYGLTIEGDYFQISDFLSRIDSLVNPKGDRVASNGRLTTVDSLALSPSDTGFPELLATISVTVYNANPSASGAGSSSAAGADVATTVSSTTPDSSTTSAPSTTTSEPPGASTP